MRPSASTGSWSSRACNAAALTSAEIEARERPGHRPRPGPRGRRPGSRRSHLGFDVHGIVQARRVVAEIEAAMSCSMCADSSRAARRRESTGRFTFDVCGLVQGRASSRKSKRRSYVRRARRPISAEIKMPGRQGRAGPETAAAPWCATSTLVILPKVFRRAGGFVHDQGRAVPSSGLATRPLRLRRGRAPPGQGIVANRSGAVMSPSTRVDWSRAGRRRGKSKRRSYACAAPYQCGNQDAVLAGKGWLARKRQRHRGAPSAVRARERSRFRSSTRGRDEPRATR